MMKNKSKYSNCSGQYPVLSCRSPGQDRKSCPVLSSAMKHVCSYNTCFVTGPSQYKFHDKQ